MRHLTLAAVVFLTLVTGSARAADNQNQLTIRRCIEAAASVYHIPPAIIVILLNVEGGALGRTSSNTNGTVDIGPMQVNQIWIPQIAAHWSTTPSRAYLGLRDSFCANVEAGTWILRQGLDEAHGDFWAGVGFYHSHDPGYKQTYLLAVLRQIMRLQALRSAKARG